MITHQTDILFGRCRHDNLFSVRFRVRWDGQRNTAAVSFPYLIDKNKFLSSESRCKKNTFHDNVSAQIINRLISDYEQTTEEIFLSYEKQHRQPTNEELRQQLKETFCPSSAKSDSNLVTELLKEFINQTNSIGSWSANTKQNYGSLLTNITDWFPRLTIQEVNEHFVQAFIHRAIVERFNNDTTIKKLGQFAAFTKWCKKKGLYTGTTDIFNVRMKTNEDLKEALIYLEWEELMRLYELPISGVLGEVRDVFCFCCLTGLRYSDVVKLRKNNIVNGTLRIVTQKTTKPVIIELNKFALEILSNYTDCEWLQGAALPVHPNQVCNRYLKELAQLAEIDTEITKVYYIGNERIEESHKKADLITMHAARRTFVVTALSLGIEPSIIMRWTGHRTYDAMKPYIAIVDDTKKNAMRKFDTLNNPYNI